jgi:hypothetical protein
MRVTVASDKYILLARDKVYRLGLYSTDRRIRFALVGVFARFGPLDCLLSLTEYTFLNAGYPRLCIVLMEDATHELENVAKNDIAL